MGYVHQATVIVAVPCDAERKLIGFFLESQGLGVREAATARQAAELLERGEFDLLVLDSIFWQNSVEDLPGLLRRSPAAANTPVVLIGQPRSIDEVNNALGRGVAAWVARRGFELDAFRQKLQAIVHSGRASTPGETAAKGAADDCRLPRLSELAVREALADAQHLPAFEFNLHDLVTATGARGRAAEQMGAIVLRDPMIATTLLQLANASTNGGGGDTAVSIQQAMEAVGHRDFFKTGEAIPALDLLKQPQWDASEFWVHSVATARVAGMLAAKLRLGTPQVAVTGGLLHDLGRYILAHFFPEHFQALLEAASSCATPGPEWEKRLIGAHHGEVGAWAMRRFGLPEVLCDVALVHHAPESSGQAVKNSSRLLGLIVQAADQITGALFPGDPPLRELSAFSHEFETAVVRADLSYDDLIDEARRLVTDLIAEMIFLFRDALPVSHLRCKKVLEDLVYHTPAPRPFDIVRTYLEARVHRLRLPEELAEGGGLPQAPIVVNLHGMHDLHRQVAALTAVRDQGLMQGRRGLVLLPGSPATQLSAVAPGAWRLVSLPAHPADWMGWLAEGAGSSESGDQPESEAA